MQPEWAAVFLAAAKSIGLKPVWSVMPMYFSISRACSAANSAPCDDGAFFRFFLRIRCASSCSATAS